MILRGQTRLAEPSGEVGIGGDVSAELVVAGEELGVAELGEAAAVEEDAGALAGGAHEAAEGLVYLGHAGNLVNTAEGGFAPEVALFGDAGALDGVHLGESGADDHSVGDPAAKEIDALGKTGTQDEKERVGEDEGFFDPRGLGGEVG
jgi:hypothetical protein